MQNAIINVNGQILRNPKPDQAQVSVFDRGYLYGDSLYEVARSYDGVFYHLDEHLERLQKSAALCRMTLAQSLELYKKEIYRTYEEFKREPGQAKAEAYMRIIVTRGVGKIGFGLNCVLTPTQYVIIVQPVDAPSKEMFRAGLKLAVSCRMRNDPRALDPAMKSGNYLNNLLAYLEATQEGFDDALLCNFEGHLTEGTTFNIFYARNGIIATPPLDVGILDGITRRLVMRLAEEQGYEVREVRFPRERLFEADEVFVTSSIKEVFPVTQVDQKKIRGGKPGPITEKLAQLYKDQIPVYVKSQGKNR